MNATELFEAFDNALPEEAGLREPDYADHNRIKVDVLTTEEFSVVKSWVKQAGGKVISHNPINGGYNVWFWPLEEAQNKQAKKAGK